jgi:hypothetical protein
MKTDGRYVTEMYAVRQCWVQKILRMFKIDAADCRDCFATPHNCRFPRYYTEEDDAMAQTWSMREVRWCNPPWSMWPAVSQKMLSSEGVSIGVLPAWDSQGWVEQLLEAAERIIYYEVGSKIFELGGRPVGGVRWGVYVVKIRGRADHEPWGPSSRRRYRRKVQRKIDEWLDKSRAERLQQEAPMRAERAPERLSGEMPLCQQLGVAAREATGDAPATRATDLREWLSATCPRRQSKKLTSGHSSKKGGVAGVGPGYDSDSDAA